jgi:hypothetical protein
MIECHSILIFMKMMQKPPLAVPGKILIDIKFINQKLRY